MNADATYFDQWYALLLTFVPFSKKTLFLKYWF